jgi:predicted metal-binding membrane protein
MNKLLAGLDVFRKGSVVANPTAWKSGQITASIVAGLLGALVALAKAFGYELPLTDEQILTIGGSIVAIAGLFINTTATIVSSDKIGLPSRNDSTNVSPLTGR